MKVSRLFVYTIQYGELWILQLLCFFAGYLGKYGDLTCFEKDQEWGIWYADRGSLGGYWNGEVTGTSSLIHDFFKLSYLFPDTFRGQLPDYSLAPWSLMPPC